MEEKKSENELPRFINRSSMAKSKLRHQGTTFYEIKIEKSQIDPFTHIDKFIDQYWKQHVESHQMKYAWEIDEPVHKLIHQLLVQGE